MRKPIMGLVMPFVLLLATPRADAQAQPPTWAPLELFGCNYVEGADMSDLDGVIETWNEWMDANGMDNYTGVVLSPHFTAGSFPFEVLWLGAWEDGAALGTMQQWLTEGAEIENDFAEVVQCPLHQAFAVNNVQPPAEATGIVPVAFSNCTLNEGRIGPEARAAIVEFTQFLAQNDSVNGHWILRPAAGEELDADYSFKWVRAYSSWGEVGKYFDIMYNGGGFQRLGQLIGRVMSCDSPRLYNSRLVREMAED